MKEINDERKVDCDMTDISTLLEELEKGGLDERLCRLGCLETG